MYGVEHGVSRVVRHKEFYIRGGDMTVLVENHLYRIHSYFFERESLFFRNKFASASENGEDRLGATEEAPYSLEDVKSEDFARFLWVFYNPKYGQYDAPLEWWLSILHLATRWQFDGVKELTIAALEQIEIEGVEKIAIYHNYNINKHLLVPSYMAVCRREKPLSLMEGSKLGMETVLRIAEARERLRQQAMESGVRSPTYEDFGDDETEKLVRELFQVTGRSPTVPSTSNINPNYGGGGAAPSSPEYGSVSNDKGGRGSGSRSVSMDIRTPSPSPGPAPLQTNMKNTSSGPQSFTGSGMMMSKEPSEGPSLFGPNSSSGGGLNSIFQVGGGGGGRSRQSTGNSR